MFIEMHVVQSLPFSNPNRDDLGQPKTAFYGGVERSRISSQSCKRVVRHRVEQQLGDQALRTRRVPSAVESVLLERGWETGKARNAGQAVIKAAGIGGLELGDEGNTTSMLYLPAGGITALADVAEKNWDGLLAAAKDPKKAPEVGQAIRDIFTQVNPSIGAFGRMLANSNESTVDGAVSVAHPFTTHATVSQPDFFTAVDDLPGEDAGSAHMGTAVYTSGVFYRYASINVRELAGNLGGDLDTAQDVARLVLEEFALYTPEAKATSTAPHTPPVLVYTVARSDRPVSLAGAFEKPVRATRESGHAGPSVEAMNSHAGALRRFFGTAGVVAAGHVAGDTAGALDALGESAESLEGLLGAVLGAAFAPGAGEAS